MIELTCNLLESYACRDLADRACQVESDGYDAIYFADHLGLPDPFQTLAVVARSTDRIRVGPLTLNTAVWRPMQILRACRTSLDLFGDRLDVGVGAGYGEDEFKSWNVSLNSLSSRAAGVVEALEAVDLALHSRPGDTSSVRRIVGGIGDTMLCVSGRYADLASLTGTFERRGRAQSKSWPCSLDETDERVEQLSRFAQEAGRNVGVSILVQAVFVSDDSKGVARNLINERGGGRSVADVIDTPFFLIGSIDEIASKLLKLSRRYECHHFVIHEPFIHEFTPVIAALRKLERRSDGDRSSDTPP